MVTVPSFSLIGCFLRGIVNYEYMLKKVDIYSNRNYNIFCAFLQSQQITPL